MPKSLELILQQYKALGRRTRQFYIPAKLQTAFTNLESAYQGEDTKEIHRQERLLYLAYFNALSTSLFFRYIGSFFTRAFQKNSLTEAARLLYDVSGPSSLGGQWCLLSNAAPFQLILNEEQNKTMIAKTIVEDSARYISPYDSNCDTKYGIHRLSYHKRLSTLLQKLKQTDAAPMEPLLKRTLITQGCYVWHERVAEALFEDNVRTLIQYRKEKLLTDKMLENPQILKLSSIALLKLLRKLDLWTEENVLKVAKAIPKQETIEAIEALSSNPKLARLSFFKMLEPSNSLLSIDAWHPKHLPDKLFELHDWTLEKRISDDSPLYQQLINCVINTHPLTHYGALQAIQDLHTKGILEAPLAERINRYLEKYTSISSSAIKVIIYLNEKLGAKEANQSIDLLLQSDDANQSMNALEKLEKSPINKTKKTIDFDLIRSIINAPNPEQKLTEVEGESLSLSDGPSTTEEVNNPHKNSP